MPKAGALGQHGAAPGADHQTNWKCLRKSPGAFRASFLRTSRTRLEGQVQRDGNVPDQVVVIREPVNSCVSDVERPADARATTISVIGGVSQFDLAGTGTASILGARVDLEITRVFLGEAGFTAMRPSEQFSRRATYAFPEVQIQAQIPLRIVRPYVGAGVGYALASAHGSYAGSTRTLAGAGGVRVLIPNTRTTLRAELRVRGIGYEFAGAMAEWTLGVGRRF